MSAKKKLKEMAKKSSFDYNGMMRDVRKQFPGIKLNGKSPYTPDHKK